MESIKNVLIENNLVTAFALIGLTMYLSYFISTKLTRGKLHGSAIAIMIGLLLAYYGGTVTGGEKGLADISIFAGIGIMGGGMLRDLAIISTAFGVNFNQVKSAGVIGFISLFIGIFLSFFIGVIVALSFGYSSPVDITTIGAGTATYIVGPVTGSALGASSEVITLSIAAGLIKSMLTMVFTPFAAKFIGLNNPRSAMIFGGLMGTTSGTAAGLAATDPKLVPYGAMTATFYTGLGCLLCPSLLYFIIQLTF
ncbi:malonate transporter subunit MadM [Priestia filamentosa]|uniref:Malonate transporter subunit MadM n=1 Tax=Priestia filamentosa TaxID=1402861 RepID=A0A1X7DMH7_9BACI|nr:malonate transporter subunit MadM [Priestia filamentosa]AKO93289.1 malonate transporter subunit MadM [Priestia filamentosa]MDT3763445.1 malonate transporter subunit MadM [Priestia filamentosa]OXS72056.1 malonate transporter subunit MadM [Priestia filamentosa]RJS63416.1 malonate transporter subunit MadM [Priestia filamentosa]WRU93886.1 malonate transporter subunit MadM [Priestia filamentosa]